MKFRVALILLLCEFCVDIEAIFFGGETSMNKTSPAGIASSFSDFADGTCRVGVMSPFPVFDDLPTYTSFVDKTLLIKEFFKISGPRQFHLITCPPEFGKTANLNMIKKFVEYSYNERYLKLFNDSSSNLKITPLLHSNDGLLGYHFREQECIYISFKSIGRKTLTDITRGFGHTVCSIYEKIKVKSDGLVLLTREEEELRSKLKNFKKPVTEEEAVNGLFEFVIVATSLFSKRNITILIDDYDDPIQNAIERNLNVTHIYELVKKMFSSLFNSGYRNLRYAIITGTLNVLELTQFNRMSHWNFLDNHVFTKYFGLTTSEVDRLLSYHSIDSKTASFVKQYYGRYSSRDSTAEIYNPYSIIRWLSCRDLSNNRAAFENYWPVVSKLRIPNFLASITKNNKIFRKVIAHLLASKKIKFKLMKYWTLDDLEELQKITHDKLCKLTVRRLNLILSYLFHNGYLSHADEPNTYRVSSEEITNYLNESLVQEIEDGSLDVEQMKAILSPLS